MPCTTCLKFELCLVSVHRKVNINILLISFLYPQTGWFTADRRVMNFLVYVIIECRKKRRKKRMGKRPRKKAKSDLDKILEMEKRSISKSLGGHSVQELQDWLSKEAQRRGRADGFVLDKKGCYENVLYERLYRLDIPAYYRNGYIGNKLRWVCALN